jgi:hypothetical protein
MRRLMFAALIAGLVIAPAFGAAYDKTETTSAYTFRLRVPAQAMAIAPLKKEIFDRFKKNCDTIKPDALSEQKEVPQYFHPYDLDTQWRVTFDSPQVISLSGYSFIDENGAHPNAAFDSVVWDKQASRAVALPELFAKGQSPAALKAIATAATASFTAWLAKSGYPADASEAAEGISADGSKLGHYALTYAKGDAKANGIVLLHGAGEAWAHVLGDIKLPIPVSVFRKYLTPKWAAQFK